MATELEIMAHARGYIDKLAKGINPLTGEPLGEDDIVNNVRISRCLFYVSDVLRQVIEQGGTRKSQKALSVPFSLTQEQKEKYVFFEGNAVISSIVSRLNELREDGDMKRLIARNVTDYLLQKGLLILAPGPGDKMRREPSETGRQLGLSSEVRSGERGVYLVILYDRRAQQYILDHLEEITAFRQPGSPDIPPEEEG